MRQIKFKMVFVMTVITLLLVSSTNNEKNNNINSEVNLPIQMLPPQIGDEAVSVETEFGKIKFKLFNDFAPNCTEIFKGYINSDYYSNSTFDRLEPSMAVQLDFQSTYPDDLELESKQPYPYESSNSIKNIKGAVCLIYQYGEYVSPSIVFVLGGEVSQEDLDLMKFLGDETYSENIIEAYEKYGGQPNLDGRFTVIGQIYEGFEILDMISTFEVRETEDNVSQHVLIEPIKIKAITIETIK